MYKILLPAVFIIATHIYADDAPVKQQAADAVVPQDNFVKTLDEAKALGPKNTVFFQKYEVFADTAKMLTAMKKEFIDAKPERQQQIQIEYSQFYQQGLDIYKDVLKAALEAFQEAPNRNPNVQSLLYPSVVYGFRRENYEETVNIFKTLISGDTPAPLLDKKAEVFYVYAGFSAMMTMDLDNAETWLEKAKQLNVLEKALIDLEKETQGKHTVRTLLELLKQIPQFRVNWAKEQEIRKAETEAGEKDPEKKLPRVEIETTKGKIVLELFENEAPNTVANFINLVEKKFYNGTPFHRVLPCFMAQGGDPNGTGRGGPGYTIDDECGPQFPKMRLHFRGSISMANSNRPGTNGSQFFLTFVPTSSLNGKHTVFGRIVDGLEVLSDIQRIDPEDKDAAVPEVDKIVTAKVLNKRNHPYEPKKH